MLQEATGGCILRQKIFDALPQRGIVAALLIQKGLALGWLKRQRDSQKAPQQILVDRP